MNLINMNCNMDEWGKERLVRCMRSYLEQLKDHDHTEAEWYFLMGHIYELKELMEAIGNKVALFMGEGLFSDCIYKVSINGAIIYHNPADESLIARHIADMEKNKEG